MKWFNYNLSEEAKTCLATIIKTPKQILVQPISGWCFLLPLQNNGKHLYPANIYLFRVNDKNTTKRCAICSKLAMKTPKLCRSYVFVVNFKHISYLFVPVILLTFDMYLLLSLEREH